MALPTFHDFLKRNAYRTTTARIPASQRLMLILNAAGQRGMSYSELARMLDLDSKTLRNLLNTLVSTREITVSYAQNGIPTYRARW
jgi:DNA-directed RNA polymerase specialized sigma24 family protein